MKLCNLLLGLAMLATSGLVAMSPEEKQQFAGIIQDAQHPDTVYGLVAGVCNGPMAVQFGLNKRHPNDHAGIFSFCTSRRPEEVPERERDIIAILNACLAQDLRELMQDGINMKIVNERLRKYARIPSVNVPGYLGDTADHTLLEMLGQKNGPATKNYLSEILKFRQLEQIPTKHNLSLPKLLCTTLAIAAIYGICCILCTKKKKTEKKGDLPEDKEQEHETKEQEENHAQA